MDEPDIVDAVARWESGRGAVISEQEITALIASWRERGDDADAVRSLRAANEDLRAMLDAVHAILDDHDGDGAVWRIRDVLYGGAEDKI